MTEAKKPTATDKTKENAAQPAMKDPLSHKACIFEPVVYARSKPAGQRVLAVSAALELIAKRVAGPTPSNLEAELKNLSKYADLIQAATKVK